MTVKELIKKMEEFDGNTEVKIYDEEYTDYVPLTGEWVRFENEINAIVIE